MSIIEAFDDKSSSLIEVSAFYETKKVLADVCIVSFSRAVLEMFLHKYEYEIVTHITNSNGNIDIYAFKENEKQLLFYMSPITATLAATSMYEVFYITGVKKFIIFGSCGVLDNEKCFGKLIVPYESYRDEGISYHYMPPTDYIEIKKWQKISNVFDKYNLRYVIGRSYCTDAMFMETVNKIKQRKDEGCIVVEMESSALQALANYYGYEIYPFFFTADSLDGLKWNKESLGSEKEKDIQKETFNIALKIALEIYE